MGVAYANLDWMRERRGIDTRELDRRTTEALRPARTDRQARKAIQAFVAAFDDPHLSVERHPPGWWVRLSGMWRDEGALRITRDATGDEACGALGYSDIDPGFGLEVEALPAWHPVVGPPFPAGTFRLPDGRVAGLLRIAEFGERKYGAVCVTAWDASRRAFTGAHDADRGANVAGRGTDRVANFSLCGPACQDSFRSAVLDSLTARVGASASALRGAGAALLVLDLTGNGGGSEWSRAVAGLLGDRPLRSGAVGFVKHPHWIDRLTEEAARLARESADPRLPADARAASTRARLLIEAALAEARVPCDRRFLWLGGEHLPPCRQDVIADLPSDDEFSGDRLGGGSLWILVDGGTASAAEEVPALLADNGAGRVIGERTFGAGCGYTNGGIPAELPHSRLTVWMPDCARYRRDGTNEVEGVKPDVEIAWSEMDGGSRARALVAALAR
jgi:hypothetical protein